MNCLKCGRTVPDQILLCPECLSESKTPAKAKFAPLQEEVQKAQLVKLGKNLRLHRRLLAFFVVLTLAATVMLAEQWYLMQQQSSQIATQTSRINSLETAMQELQSELDQANALNDTMNSALAEAQQALDTYKAYTGLSPDMIDFIPEAQE